MAESSVALPPASVEMRMPHNTPPIPVIESFQIPHGGPPSHVCLSCDFTVKDPRTILKLGAASEPLIFVCPSCNEISTMEVKRHLWRDILKMRRRAYGNQHGRNQEPHFAV
jgi:hypothetical protein